MTKVEIMEYLQANENENDFDFYEYNGVIHFTIHDFEGFNEDWEEIFRDYNDVLVEEIYNFFVENCNEYTEDLYTDFQFDDCVVSYGYESYDI